MAEMVGLADTTQSGRDENVKIVARGLEDWIISCDDQSYDSHPRPYLTVSHSFSSFLPIHLIKKYISPAADDELEHLKEYFI